MLPRPISRMIPYVALLASFVFGAPLFAQNQETITVAPPDIPATIYTPEIQLGSADRPAVVTEPPVIEQISVPTEEPRESNATPASTELLSTRHFDFITSPMAVRPGSMEDTSISLGEYARQLRAQRQKSPTPNAIANPSDSH
jgi:hypothetical protein